jgi:hypothetical protein
VAAKGNDASAQVWWFENPGPPAITGWPESLIAEVETESEVKDLYVADLDHDARPDVAVRTKHYFALYFQESPRRWTERKIENREREGMTLADLDEDGDYDAIMNGYWLEKPGFNVTWYSSDDPRAGPGSWRKHEIGVVDYCHTLRAADMDGDGDDDIVAATLKRTETPQIVVFLNSVEGQEWTRFKVADESAYKARVGDIDDDRDMDIVTSRSWEDPPIMLWRNQLIE